MAAYATYLTKLAFKNACTAGLLPRLKRFTDHKIGSCMCGGTF